MGSLLSLPVGNKRSLYNDEVLQHESCKRMRMSSVCNDESPRLFPCLPDELSYQILARVPRTYYLSAKLVCKSWKTAITSSEVYRIRKELGTTEEWVYILEKIQDDRLQWHALDPKSGRWQRLPPMPNITQEEQSKRAFSGSLLWNVVGSTIKIADLVKGWFARKNGLDRLPFCGCAVGALDGCIYVLGGFLRASAMQCVWKYEPRLNVWHEVCPMSTGRAYCKTGLLDNKLYVVGGVCRGRGGLTPLKSAEVFDPSTGQWTPVRSMPFAKAHVLPAAFLADMLKPIATGMTIYRGNLCVPQSLYSWPFFVDVGGEMYDPKTDCWIEMPTGMGEGWPARQAGTKLSVVVNGELYALEPSSSLDSGKIKVYNPQIDAWQVVIPKVPIRDFTDCESPYLLVGFLGKLHVITKDANNFTIILQADLPNAVSISSPTSSVLTTTLGDTHVSLTETENDFWNIVASKNFGLSELVSCQVLDI